ncbi:MAG: ABC transporter substrate-binding protein [Candidatus Sumerlaeia bacterium]|nr:ABC transporter substrate-binding protein [Candidatus Sumerlaeia bacterium]
MAALLTRREFTRLALAALALPTVACVGRQEERRPDGRLVIHYWEKWEDFEKEAMGAVVDAYNASQDRVFVNYLSTGQIDQKLLLATAGGNPPDVAGLWAWRLYTYAEMGALEPLDALMRRDGLSTDDYLPSIIEQCRYRDFTWALPTTPATLALHYNRDLFAEAGLDPDKPPRTIAELDAAAERLTKRGPRGAIDQLGFSPTEPGWWNDRWGYWFGGDLLTPDARRVTIDSAENIAAYEWVRSFPQRYGREEIQLFQAAGGQFNSAQNLFLSGKVGMVLQGPWMATFVDKFAPGLNWGVAPFPAVSEAMDPVTICEADVLVVPKGCRHREEAWAFIKFTQRPENMERLCLGQRKFSPLRSVSPDFAAKHPHPHIGVFRGLAESPNAKGAPESPAYSEYRDEINYAFDLLWNLKQEPAAALAEAARRTQPKLDRRNEQWDRIAAQRRREWEGGS